MALNIEPEGKTKVKSINTRREKHGDDSKIGIDINLISKVDIDQHPELVYQLIGGSKNDALAFWHPDTGAVIYSGLTELKSTAEFDKGQTLEIEKKKFSGIKIKNLSLQPQMKRTADLYYQVQISGIKPKDATVILSCIEKEEVSVAITGQMDLLSEGEQKLKEAEEQQFPENEEAPSGDLLTGPADQLFQEAREYVCTKERVGAQMLSQALRIEFERAGHLLDGLHAAKVLGDPDNNRVYPVLKEAKKALAQEMDLAS